MKRLGNVLLMLLLLCGAALFVLYPWLSAAQPETPFAAAQLLEKKCERGENKAVFREGSVTLDSTYDALEALYPYAFSLRSITRANKTVTLEVETARLQRQQQAEQFAKTLAASVVTAEMTDEEKYRALHDALVRLCQYDSETAQSDTLDGATAPFAADGALLDHKAVCAGYGRAFVMLCRSIGLNAIYVTSDTMNHGWNAVKLAGKTYYIDCTFDDPVPDQGDYVTDTYFLLTREEMEKTHEWNEAFYEKAMDSAA